MSMKDCYKDYKRYREVKYKQNRRYYERTSYKYPVRKWTDEEDARVLEHSISDAKLSEEIKRSVKAIGTRRRTLKKKMEESQRM